MDEIRTCNNPTCRKNYVPLNDDDDYCSDKCKKEAEKRTPTRWRTISVDKNIKNRLILLQGDIITRSIKGVKLSYNDILDTMFKLLEKQYPDLALKIMKKRRLGEAK